MLTDNAYMYCISEMDLHRNNSNKVMIPYYQLQIKLRRDNKTTVVFSRSINRDTPNAWEDILDLAKQMKKTY